MGEQEQLNSGFRAFVRRWGLFRVSVIAVASGFALWGLTQSEGFEQVIALLTLYSTFVFAAIAINTPPMGDRAKPTMIDRCVEWIGTWSDWVRRLLIAGAICILLSSLVFYVDLLLKGRPIPARLSDISTEAQQGVPFVLSASEAPHGADYLFARLTLTPVGKSGLCVAPARIAFRPILDDRFRDLGSVTVRSGEIARISIAGQFDRVAVSVTVETTQGCRVNVAVNDSYYRNRGIFP